MSRGFLLFAHNNGQIDYGLVAMCNATMIKHFMPGTSVCLVTDIGTLGWLKRSRGERAVEHAFDHIKVISTGSAENNQRRFNDGANTQHMLPWFNHSRSDAYGLSPYDETILIDGDYLVTNDRLALCWGDRADVMVNRRAVTLDHTVLDGPDAKLSPVGIPMYWATCVYFRKSEAAEMLFDLVGHVRKSYDYFRKVYDIPAGPFRNDFAFSIAIHMLNGYSQEAGLVAPLPTASLLTSLDRDDIHEVKGPGDFVFLAKQRDDAWSYRLSRVTGINVHVMNKFAIVRHADRILELHGGVA